MKRHCSLSLLSTFENFAAKWRNIVFKVPPLFLSLRDFSSLLVFFMSFSHLSAFPCLFGLPLITSSSSLTWCLTEFSTGSDFYCRLLPCWFESTSYGIRRSNSSNLGSIFFVLRSFTFDFSNVRKGREIGRKLLSNVVGSWRKSLANWLGRRETTCFGCRGESFWFCSTLGSHRMGLLRLSLTPFVV